MKKHLGQVFTPNWIVVKMLDDIGYKDKYILHKKIMEPSSGDGIFLKEIVKRYIEAAISEGWVIHKIKDGLEQNIFGIEIDKKHYEKSIQELNNLALTYKIEDVNWNISNEDALKVNYIEEMDFVVGNPPYVRVHNMEESIREYLKDNFSLCKEGMIELYIAFYELGIQMLKEDGKLSYITPNSFMNNTSAKLFREYIIEQKILHSLINFGSEQVFKESTYNAIVNLHKNHNSHIFDYYEYSDNQFHFIDNLNIHDFKDKNWNFASKINISFLESSVHESENIESIANVQYGFATLRDKIYVSDSVEVIDENYSSFYGYKVENKLLKPIVKATKYNGEEIDSRILFPYEKDENERFQVIPESKMKELYPYAYEYFLLHKEELLKRNMDKNFTVWYQFGRSQGLTNMDNEKLVIKNIIKKEAGEVIVHKLPSEVFVYSGIFITGEELDKVKEILESDDFYKYAVLSGKDMRGGYKSISTKTIKKYAI